LKYAVKFQTNKVKEVGFMGEENSTGNNLIWAITTIIVVAILASVVYFVVLKADKPSEKKIEVEITAPKS